VRLPAVRLLTPVLALAALVLGVAVPPAEAARPPVVMIVLDEFPIDAILLPDGRIDSRRFPGFAALAGVSTWFPNASSVYDSTSQAAPAILAGTLPRRGLEPDYRDHPRSVFTMLARRGYRMNVLEEASSVCPPSVCRRRRHYGNPSYNILNGRRERLERTIRSFRRSRRPVFTFHHTMLPHVPWLYLPSGRRARGAAPSALPDFKSPSGFHDRFLTQHNEQRFLLQVGFVDREIRRLLRKLRRKRLLRRALIVVTADHGLSFLVGVKDRRAVSEANVHEIATVPLFVKRPGQRRGRVNRSYASTVDIVPTIADLLGVRPDGPVDGRSVFSAAVRARTGVSILARDFSRAISVSSAEMDRRRRLDRYRRARLLGTGPWSAAFKIGPHPALLGRRPGELPRATTSTRARFAVPTRLRHIDPRARLVPTWAAGRIFGAPGQERDLALAVNGRIAATARSFHLSGDGAEWFGAQFRESALRRGRNSLALYEVRVSGRRVTALAPLGVSPR
jgi:Sulfatase